MFVLKALRDVRSIMDNSIVCTKDYTYQVIQQEKVLGMNVYVIICDINRKYKVAFPNNSFKLCEVGKR